MLASLTRCGFSKRKPYVEGQKGLKVGLMKAVASGGSASNEAEAVRSLPKTPSTGIVRGGGAAVGGTGCQESGNQAGGNGSREMAFERSGQGYEGEANVKCRLWRRLLPAPDGPGSSD